MKLSRKEVVEIYNTLKTVNLKEVSFECKKLIILNSLKLKPIADKISSENIEIVNNIKSDKYNELFSAYLNAKQKAEELKTEKSYKEFEKAAKEFNPEFTKLDTQFNEISKGLEQWFDVDLKEMPLNDFLVVYDKSNASYNVDTLSSLLKILK